MAGTNVPSLSRIAFLEPRHHCVKIRGPAKEVLTALDLDEFDPRRVDEPAEGVQRDHIILVAANDPAGSVQLCGMLLDEA